MVGKGSYIIVLSLVKEGRLLSETFNPGGPTTGEGVKVHVWVRPPAISAKQATPRTPASYETYKQCRSLRFAFDEKMLSTLAALALCLVGTYCWGNLGHRAVAYLAVEYLTCHETQQLQRLAGFDDLSDAALWADEVSKQPPYAYSAPWHYLNVHDRPPDICNISLPRDHETSSADIITAFANHTLILASKESTASQRTEAIRYIIHWIGDVHQPLHVEGFQRGGVDFPTMFDGRQTNLHAVWDVDIPAKRRHMEDEKHAARVWAQELFSREAHPEQKLLEECHDIVAPVMCILEWAQQSNAAVCNAVLKQGLEYLRTHDLGESYYETNIAVVEVQIGRAGRRLAAWLKALLHALGDHNNGAQQFLQQWIRNL